MNKVLLYVCAAAVLLVATSSVSIRSSSTGIAGYTGAPGSFGTCANCHGGGSSASSGITITAVPAFTNNEYMPDSTYQVTVNAVAPGFGRFGFACEILTPSNVNSGTISPNSPGGVKVLQQGFRRNAVHTSPKITITPAFTFPWKAPSTGTAIVYAMVNAVNGNNNTTGDFPLSPVSLTLTPKAKDPDTTITSIRLHSESPVCKLFPNPARGAVQLTLKSNARGAANVAVINAAGVVCAGDIYSVTAGDNRLTILLGQLPAGLYSVRVVLPDAPVFTRPLLVE